MFSILSSELLKTPVSLTCSHSVGLMRTCRSISDGSQSKKLWVKYLPAKWCWRLSYAPVLIQGVRKTLFGKPPKNSWVTEKLNLAVFERKKTLFREKNVRQPKFEKKWFPEVKRWSDFREKADV